MADKADRLVSRWREHTPPEVTLDDVRRVVEAYFAETYIVREGTGSHLLIIDDPVLALAEKVGIPSGSDHGKLTISTVSGRHVKKWLVDDLLKAIAAKQRIAEIAEQSERSKERS